MMELLTELRQSLRACSDEAFREASQRYFKEPVKCYGIRNLEVSKLGKEYLRKQGKVQKQEVFRYCEQLFSSGMLEESFIACQWSYSVHRQYIPDDIIIFKGWVQKYVNNWATCDSLCNHSVGSLLEKYPTLVEELKTWAPDFDTGTP